MPSTKSFDKVFLALKHNGFLMLSDATLPSISNIITGEKINGSWWGHPAGNEIFNCSSEVDDHKDVISSKLINGKVTFIHRSMWTALLGVVSMRQPWQTKLLSPAAKKILLKTARKSMLRASDIVEIVGMESKERSAAISELEKKLLVHSFQIHTESGKHERVLQSWDSLIGERFNKKKLLTPRAGIEAIEKKVSAALGQRAVKIKYPW